MIGAPGCGKSMLAARMPTTLPPLTEAESLETTRIYSATGRLGDEPLLTRRPFRTPHHTISDAGMVSGTAALVQRRRRPTGQSDRSAAGLPLPAGPWADRGRGREQRRQEMEQGAARAASALIHGEQA